MQTIESVIADVQQATSNPASETRYIHEHILGCFGRQGDIYFTGIEKLPEGCVKVGTNQLAEGDTIGSRHIVGDGVVLYKSQDYGQIVETTIGKFVQGYVMEVTGDRGLLTHPEHATFDLPRGCYQVSHQYDPISDRKVAD